MESGNRFQKPANTNRVSGGPSRTTHNLFLSLNYTEEEKEEKYDSYGLGGGERSKKTHTTSLTFTAKFGLTWNINMSKEGWKNRKFNFSSQTPKLGEGAQVNIMAFFTKWVNRHFWRTIKCRLAENFL